MKAQAAREAALLSLGVAVGAASGFYTADVDQLMLGVGFVLCGGLGALVWALRD